MFARASSSVSPSDTQPGSSGHTAEWASVSGSCSRTTLNVIPTVQAGRREWRLNGGDPAMDGPNAQIPQLVARMDPLPPVGRDAAKWRRTQVSSSFFAFVGRGQARSLPDRKAPI